MLKEHSLTQKRPRLYVPLALGLSLLVLGATIDFTQFTSQVYSNCLAARTVRNRDLPPVSAREAIVVLTGDQIRIPRGFELLQERGSPVLIISGTYKGTTLTDVMNQQPHPSVPASEIWNRIVLEGKSSSTLENSIESARLLEARGVERVILVTSDYHMYRALKIFRQRLPNLTFIAYPVVSPVSELLQMPPHHALEGAGKLVWEYGKWILYRVRF